MGNFLRTLAIVIILSGCFLPAYPQGSTSKGTEFWTAYMANTNPPGSNSGSVMVLYLTSDVNTTGLVSVSDGSFNQSFTVTANGITVINIPASAYIAGATKNPVNKGIHITSALPIAAYAHIFAEASSGATLLLPVQAMGKDYTSINYTQMANEDAASTYAVIGTQDNTTVQITPTAGMGPKGGQTPGQPFTITLNKGEVYQGTAGTDLTGTHIQSITSGTSTCQRIAVFSGSSRIQIGCNASLNSSDCLFQQVYPTSAWGEHYITVPLKDRNYDIFRIVLSNPNTNVTLNGAVLDPKKLINGLYYEFNSATTNVISGDKPIQVVQYAVSQGNTINCGSDPNDLGDPEMIYLTPLEQTLNNVTLFSTSNYKILNNYINVVIKSSAAGSFVLDSKSFVGFKKVSGDDTYSYVQIPVSTGTHTLSANDGFSAITYGFGQHESYGYAGGANLQNLNNYISLQNPQTGALQANGCTGENYNLQITLPFQTSSITWDFNNGTQPYQQLNPVQTGTTLSGTQTLYTYNYVKGPLGFKAGSYKLTATAVNPLVDVCGSASIIEFDYQISAPPVAAFTTNVSQPGYGTQFTDQSTSGSVIEGWQWDFGDGQVSYEQNPVNIYAKAGIYNVNLVVTDVDGCSSSVQNKIKVPLAATLATGGISACIGTASSSPNIEKFTASAQGINSNITVTAPANFEVSTNLSNGYASTITLISSGGVVNPTDIYVRSTAGAPLGNISGDVMLMAAGSAGEKVAVAGIVNSLPTMDNVQSQITANGLQTTAIKFTGTTNVFNWVNDTPTIGLPASGSGNIAPFTAINNGSTPIVANLMVTPVYAGLAYITNSGSNSVSIINTSNNTITNVIPVGKTPYGVCLSPDGSKVYVSDFGSDSVSVINTASNTEIARIPANRGPFGLVVSIDGTKLYVANYNSTTVTVINTSSYVIEGVITVGSSPYAITMSPDGQTIYVTNEGSSTISAINTATNAVSTISGANLPEGIALSADGTRLYIANALSNNVEVIDPTNDSRISNIPVDQGPAGLCLSHNGNLLFLTNQTANEVSIIDTKTNTVIKKITGVGITPTGISVTPNGDYIYVTNQGSNDVAVIDTINYQVVTRVPVNSRPYSLGSFVTNGTGCSGTPVPVTITVEPSLPVLITTLGLLSPLSSVYGTVSVSTNFNLSALNLRQPIIITPPYGFEISTDNTNFSSKLSVGANGNLGNIKIYLRLTNTDPAAKYTGNIILTTQGTDEVDIPMSNCEVTPAPLTIAADNKGKIYELPNPKLTITYSGFVNNETPAYLTLLPQLSTTAMTNSQVGEYPIIASGAVDDNYTITYVPGVLTVYPSLFIPNTFTPNGDGINDVWQIQYLDNYPTASINVFNRYGTKVYISTGYSTPWDGKYKGAYLPSGTYYYLIDFKSYAKIVSGYVTIVR